MLHYQMPRPMRTIPIANHPSTPTEMIASSVMRELEGLGFGFESESAGFMTSGESKVAKTIDVQGKARSVPLWLLNGLSGSVVRP